jgi:hypothetical protein
MSGVSMSDKDQIAEPEIVTFNKSELVTTTVFALQTVSVL